MIQIPRRKSHAAQVDAVLIGETRAIFDSLITIFNFDFNLILISGKEKAAPCLVRVIDITKVFWSGRPSNWKEIEFMAGPNSKLPDRTLRI